MLKNIHQSFPTHHGKVVGSTYRPVPKLHGLDILGANAAQLAQGNGHEELAGAPSYKNEVEKKVRLVWKKLG